MVSGICSTRLGRFGLPLHFFIGYLFTVYDIYITISIFKSKAIHIYVQVSELVYFSKVLAAPQILPAFGKVIYRFL